MDNFFMIYVEGKNMPYKRFETLEEAETEEERRMLQAVCQQDYELKTKAVHIACSIC